MPKSTSFFKEWLDYSEGSSNKGVVYFGSPKFDPLKAYRSDLAIKKDSSP